MLTPAEAEKLILEHQMAFLREDCPLNAAHGRVLRADLLADRDLPPFHRVTMDGYALRAASLAAGITQFSVESTQAAGMRAFVLGPAADACVEVMTGAVLPDGADCVLPYEDTKRSEGSPVITTTGVVPSGFAVHRRGSDHPSGAVIVRAGTKITGREVAVAAAIGASTVTVAAQPKIAVVATGDELVEIDAGVAPHQIRRSNDYAIRAALLTAGYTRVERFHLRDVRHEIEHRLWHIVAEHDVVLISGGVSKGKFDFLPAVLDAHGVRKVFQGVAQRPGKPFWFGVTQRRTSVFALPGNPVSAYTCLHRYVLPALAQASGLPPAPDRRAVLSAPVAFKPPLAYFLPVRISSNDRAELLAAPAAANTSGDFAGLVGTDGFVELPAHQTEFPIGYVARFFAW
ncbi:MAG: molybdopterin molybdotransferase MoeA [Opitutus sp.]